MNKDIHSDSDEIWVVESYSRNMRPSGFAPPRRWSIAKICKTKRLADAWREDAEERNQANRDSGYESAWDSQYRTVKYVRDATE